MKVAILGVSAANIVAYTITVEGKVFNGRDLMPLYRNMSVVSDGANFTIYIDAPFDIQAATTDGSTAASIVVIENQDAVECKNFTASGTVAKFTKGKSYLVVNAAVAPTTIVPNVKSIVACLNTGNDSAVHAAARYLYVATEDANVLNGSSVDVIPFDYDWAAFERNSQRRAQAKNAEWYSYLSASSY